MIKALLMHPERDFDLQQVLPAHERDLCQDLELDTLLQAMARDDEFVFEVSRRAILAGPHNDVETILYRQQIVKDALNNAEVVREIYSLAVEAMERKKKTYFGILTHYPSGVLRSAIDIMEMFVVMLQRLRGVADVHARRFGSKGFQALFAMLRKEFSDQYLEHIETHLSALKFRHGVLMSAELGTGSEGAGYTLRLAHHDKRNWLERLLGKGPRSYSFRLHERDEAGGRILTQMQDRGINAVANALAQSADHILHFFDMLRAELAFYVGVVNLRDRLAHIGVPATLPVPQPLGARQLRFLGLCDVCLALSMGRRVVPNAVDADGKSLAIITGANQGGKSSFLRAIGLAQSMMQSGMFVAAESFESEICSAIFTHYKREEDATMKKGKLDEELSRMSDIVEAIEPNSLLLFNESFAATNEREGSEIAREIVLALLEKRVKMFFVTHLYAFAHGLYASKMAEALFLRAERLADGTRTFKLIDGEPLETSYGEDLYREVFGQRSEQASAG